MGQHFLSFGFQSTRVLCGAALSAALASSACGGDAATTAGSSIESPEPEPPANNGGSGSLGTGGSQSAVVPNDDTGGNLDVGGGLVVGAGGQGSFAECAGDVRAASPVGIDMYVVLDRSGSMEEGASATDNNAPGDCPLSLDGLPANQSKWCLATHALAKYFASEGAAQNRAGLQYMPLEGEEDDDSVCPTGGGITQPEVPLSPLPVAAATDALIQSLDTNGPQGNGTPIEAALRGITAFTTATQDPSRVMIGIFITDGDPNGCEEEPAMLAPILSAHLAATGMRTFIIGMNGATNANLETIALAGGAPEHADFCGVGAPTPCHYWNVGQGDPAAFVSALEQIQQSAALPCDFALPLPPNGQDLDVELVNVTFINELGVPTLLPRANDVTSCVADGWYYDNIAAPTTVKLCPTTCAAAEVAGTGAAVDITFGCATVIQ